MLAVWNRIGADDPELDVSGDHDLLNRRRELTSF
jgi:hypothetical protein